MPAWPPYRSCSRIKCLVSADYYFLEEVGRFADSTHRERLCRNVKHLDSKARRQVVSSSQSQSMRSFTAYLPDSSSDFAVLQRGGAHASDFWLQGCPCTPSILPEQCGTDTGGS